MAKSKSKSKCKKPRQRRKADVGPNNETEPPSLPSSLSSHSENQCLCFQDVMKTYQQKQRQQQNDKFEKAGDENDVAAQVFFELANAPMVSYRIETTSNANTRSTNTTIERTIRVHQDQADACGQHTGGIVWETSFLLLNYLRQKFCPDRERRRQRREEEEERFTSTSNVITPSLLSSSTYASSSYFPCGNTVVEVGAGCGLLGLGIYHSRLAQRVLLTETESVLPNLLRNVSQNNSSSDPTEDVRACVLDWTRYQDDCRKHCQLEPHSVDMIVGTDVVFSARFVGPLLKTLRYLAHSKTTILLCLQERCPDAHRLLLESARKDHGLEVRDISKQVAEVPTCEWGNDLDCCVLQLHVVDGGVDDDDDKKSKKKRKRIEAA